VRFDGGGSGAATARDGPAGDLSGAVQAGEQQPAGGPDDQLERDADGEQGAEEAAHRRPGEHPFEDLEGDEGSGLGDRRKVLAPATRASITPMASAKGR
jgi:hypothetical protein